MRIIALALAIIAAQVFATTTYGGVSAISPKDSEGRTNLQKITAILKETKENQRNEVESRKRNVSLAKERLRNCANITESNERAACEKKYKALVKSSLRACGVECR